MLAEFSIVPIGKGESMGEDISRVIRIVEQSGLPYRANPMGTVVEGDWDEVMALFKRCHEEVLKNAPRVYSTLSIDDRPSKPKDRITEKIRSVEKRLGKEIKK